jgi:hypothetical protein
MIRQTDLLIKSMVELILKDMRDNLYLLDDVFADLLQDPYLKDIYAKDVENAKQWLKNTDIKVLLALRSDTQEFPCISIALGSDAEDESKSTLSDQTVDTRDFEPSEINKPIGYVVKPFTPASYDQELGLIECGDADISGVAEGMLVIDPDTGVGHEVFGFSGTNGILIAAGTELNSSKLGILPKNRKWRANVEASFFRQTYEIGCHVADDPATLIWLHSIILYGMLRHREMFTSRCFALSSVQSSGISRNSAFQPGAENAFSRFITLSASTQHTWLKTPKRFLESSAVDGLKFDSNTDTDQIAADPTGDGWDTVPSQQSSRRRVFRRE